MTPDLLELGKRAVACSDWVWIHGMRTMSGARVVAYNGGWECVRGDASDWADYGDMSGELPDLTDPATLGCILALVREAWADPRIHAAPALYAHDALPEYRYTISHWHVYSPGQYNCLTEPPKCAVTGKTEAEALVAALEAAP